MTHRQHTPWTVVDLFSGAGGASYGFHTHPEFEIVGAVDRQVGKPSSGHGKLECNKTYRANIGLEPLEADLRELSPVDLRNYVFEKSKGRKIDVLICCAPCTGFSRTIRKNLINDDPRNSLVAKSADFLEAIEPQVFVMENVGELLNGKFSGYFSELRRRMSALGYSVAADVDSLETYGLPQLRRRALIIAAKDPFKVRRLEDLWAGYAIQPASTHVRRAIGHLPTVEAGQCHSGDPMHVSPSFSLLGHERLKRIPQDGGSWSDLLRSKDGEKYLIPSMKKYVSEGRVGPHPDIYGRMAWDRPSITLKRECSNAGNGRYCHPDQDRHCTVREMAIIQGFPSNYVFKASSVSNMYRHIGDAVPPLISFQIAHAISWTLGGVKPAIRDIILPNTHLTKEDVVKVQMVQPELTHLAAAADTVE